MQRFHAAVPPLLLFSATFYCAGSLLAQGSAKVSRDARQATGDTVPVIVQYDHDPSDDEGLAFESRHRGHVALKLHGIQALSAMMPKAELESLAHEPGVKYVSLDRPLLARDAGR